MGDVTIRPAAAADAATLSGLAERLAGFPLPSWRQPQAIASADARAMLEALAEGGRDNQVFVAERDGQPAGCLHILVILDFFGVRHAHISVLATTAAAEGTGVGRTLMAHAEAWARERGLTLVTLNVFTQNQRARAFYARAGFEVEMLKYAKQLDTE